MGLTFHVLLEIFIVHLLIVNSESASPSTRSLLLRHEAETHRSSLGKPIPAEENDEGLDYEDIDPLHVLSEHDDGTSTREEDTHIELEKDKDPEWECRSEISNQSRVYKRHFKDIGLTYYTGEGLANDSGLCGPKNPDVHTVIIVQHGAARKGWAFTSCMATSAKAFFQSTPAELKGIMLIGPQFFSDTLKKAGEKERYEESPNGGMQWGGDFWLGPCSEGTGCGEPLSAFAAWDQILGALVAETSPFPNLKTVKLYGYSGGAQFLQRYAIAGRGIALLKKAGKKVDLLIGAPASLMYLDERRPVIPDFCGEGGFCQPEAMTKSSFKWEFIKPKETCDGTYDNWGYGLQEMASTGSACVRKYMSAINVSESIQAFGRLHTSYFVGSYDVKSFVIEGVMKKKKCNATNYTKLGSGCGPSPSAVDCGGNLQGYCRYMKLHAWVSYLKQMFPQSNPSLVTLRSGHDFCGIMQKPDIQQLLFGG